MISLMRSLVHCLILPALAAAQLSGTVGPTTTTAEKAAKKVCNILNYGGVASASTDNGAALLAAWTACASGGEVYIPSGSYGLSTFVTLDSGTGVSINLEGIIYRIGSVSSGTMISIENTSDFEFYSATSKGAIQGYGYVFLQDGDYGPRILRLTDVTNFSLHDFVLVDAGAFHCVVDTGENGEIYNMVARGGNLGGLDGFDIWGTNIWVHDVEVTNKDECVTVKSPSQNILVESIYCNWSGGCAIGSLGVGTAISDVEYKNVYTQNANQMMMIKSNGGSGTLSSVSFTNFQGHDNAYMIDLDSSWTGQSVAAGSGVQYEDITFDNFFGTFLTNTRAPIQVLCPSAVPCYDLTVEDAHFWPESGSSELYKCDNAYGSGGCLRTGSSYTTYTSTVTATTQSDYAYTTMPGEITTAIGITASIAIPTIPTSFYPGATPYSKLLG